MGKLFVDQNACIGCGACVALDSEHFDFNENGLSTAISNQNLDSADLQNAIDSCPTSAISLADTDCNCEECDCCDCNCENDDCSDEECDCGCDCCNGGCCGSDCEEDYEDTEYDEEYDESYSDESDCGCDCCGNCESEEEY